ncbi:hypothetical protein [Luteimonas aquatica]|uniref:hypothetical protein n=1 Tax=Luteimonas aquatica TaxID=450364 RepID=UPI001F560C2D|nr:hypothetical protein [Luteimonas aquatica]
MVAKKQIRSGKNGKETSLRHVWLASLGAVVVARREIRGIAAKAAQRLSRRADDVQSIARGGLISVREQVEPKVEQFSAEIEARLHPVLVKLGIAPKAARPARKTAKTARRGAARRPAARTTRARKARA